MSEPVTTPCAHSFCRACLEGAFAGISLIKQRKGGGRTLRAQKNVMKCPTCPNDIADFLQNPQVCMAGCFGMKAKLHSLYVLSTCIFGLNISINKISQMRISGLSMLIVIYLL